MGANVTRARVRNGGELTLSAAGSVNRYFRSPLAAVAVCGRKGRMSACFVTHHFDSQQLAG
jgi:hypothetical protein